MARTPLLTPELATRIANLVRTGIFPETAAQFVGISKSTFARWITSEGEGYDSLRESVFSAIAAAEIALLKPVIESAIKGNTTDGKWLLARRFKQRWGESATLTLEVGDDSRETGPRETPTLDVSKLSDAQLEALEGILRTGAPALIEAAAQSGVVLEGQVVAQGPSEGEME